MWRKFQSRFALLSAAALLSTCNCFAQTRTVIEQKLSKYGWQSLPKEQRGEWVGRSSRLISIDHANRVLVGFTSRENQDLASREHPGLLFHILRFTPDGKLDHDFVLPTDNWFNNGFYLGSDDHIYARVNDALQSLSEELDAKNSDGMSKSLAKCSMNCWIIQSPSRRTLILQESNHSTSIVLDTTLAQQLVTKSCEWISFFGDSITDKFGYESSDGIRTDARRWPICDAKRVVELPLDMRNGMISPLSDDDLLILGTGKGDKRGIDLVSSSGQLRFHRDFPKNYTVRGPVRSDERGDRFAFTVETWQGGSRALDISGKIAARQVVLYSTTGEQLVTVPVRPVLLRDFDFSVSPEGHRLAILEEDVLTIVDIQ
jgi:hypothetical protein